MRLCNSLDGGKSEPGSLGASGHFVTDSIKIIKYIFLFRRGNADAGIGDREYDPVVFALDIDGDIARSFGIFDGVVDQVLD